MEQTRDFGAVLQAPAFRAAARVSLIVAAVVAGAGLVTAVVEKALYDEAQDKAYAAAWTVSGPPCPIIGPAWYKVLAIDRPTRFDFEDAHGDYAHGAASCAVIDYDHGRPAKPFTVCQFNAPFTVRVETPRGRVLLEPGSGQPATISFAGGQPACVMGAKIKDWWGP